MASVALVLALSACGDGGSSHSSSDYSAADSMSPVSGSSGSSSGSYSVGGTVAGLSGSGLTLQINGGDAVAVASDGTFAFPTALSSGTTYTVTVGTQPSISREICGVASGGTGTVSAANVTDVTVSCSTVIGFLYQLSTGSENLNEVYSYGISTGTGLLIPFGSPVATGSAPWDIAVAPGGHFVYVTNENGGDISTANLPGSISTFAVNSDTGVLTPVGSPVTVGSGEGAGHMVISAGGYLFVYDTNGGDIATLTPAGPQSLIEYSLDPTTGVPGLIGTVLTFPTSAGTEFTVTPDGRFLYVLTGSPQQSSPIANTLTVYAIDPGTGALTTGSVIAPGDSAAAMTMDPKGRFLFVASSLGTSNEESGAVQTYAIDSGSGALTAVGAGTSVVSNGGGLCAEPTGSYLYLASNLNFLPANNTLQALSIATGTGSVSTIGSVIQIQGPPTAVVCDPSGQFVFAESGGIPGATLTSFTISTNSGSAGQLVSSGPGQTSTGQGGGALAIVE
jgi:6-phosphogluconolactonase (cycloisomerase 2 family)